MAIIANADEKKTNNNNTATSKIADAPPNATKAVNDTGRAVGNLITSLVGAQKNLPQKNLSPSAGPLSSTSDKNISSATSAPLPLPRKSFLLVTSMAPLKPVANPASLYIQLSLSGAMVPPTHNDYRLGGGWGGGGGIKLGYEKNNINVAVASDIIYVGRGPSPTARLLLADGTQLLQGAVGETSTSSNDNTVTKAEANIAWDGEIFTIGALPSDVLSGFWIDNTISAGQQLVGQVVRTQTETINSTTLTIGRDDHFFIPITLGLAYHLPLITDIINNRPLLSIGIGFAGGAMGHYVNRQLTATTSNQTQNRITQFNRVVSVIPGQAAFMDGLPSMQSLQSGLFAGQKLIDTNHTWVDCTACTLADVLSGFAFHGTMRNGTFGGQDLTQDPHNETALTTQLIETSNNVTVNNSNTTQTNLDDRGLVVKPVMVPSVSIDYNPHSSFALRLEGRFYVVPSGQSDIYSPAAQRWAEDNAVAYEKNKLLWFGTITLGTHFFF